MTHALAALLLAVAAPAAATSVEVATGDWRNIPLASQRGPLEVSIDVVERIHKLVKSGTCQLPGQGRRTLNLEVPFLVHFQANGTADRVVLQKLDCPGAESVLGAMVLQHLQWGTLKPTGENVTGWYRSEIGFISS